MYVYIYIYSIAQDLSWKESDTVNHRKSLDFGDAIFSHKPIGKNSQSVGCVETQTELSKTERRPQTASFDHEAIVQQAKPPCIISRRTCKSKTTKWWHFATRVCLKIVYPIVPNGFADHYPYEKLLFHWGYTPFSDILPQWKLQIRARFWLCRSARSFRGGGAWHSDLSWFFGHQGQLTIIRNKRWKRHVWFMYVPKNEEDFESESKRQEEHQQSNQWHFHQNKNFSWWKCW